jgi:quercetin dioxygenase-like cupin family protein
MQNKAKVCIVGAMASVLTVGALRAVTAQQPPKHTAINTADLKWGAGPPGLPPGAQLAVLEGDPSKAGQFAIRLKVPDGYKVPPHWHPTDERVVVLQGTLLLGLGDKVDMPSMHTLTAGAYARMPAKTNHYAAAKGETTFQVSGMGPFEITYLNPTDDPRKKKTE